LPQGSSDFRPQAAATFFGFADIYFGVDQYLNVRLGKWKGRNDQWNSLKWSGNKAMGARPLVVNAAHRFEHTGRASLYIGLAINGAEAVQAHQNNDMYGIGIAGIDATISGTTAAAGPYGWVLLSFT
jgi:hypothetical protein